AEENAKRYASYSEKIQEVIANIPSNNSDVSHPMLERREVKRTGYILVTADSGLAGAYKSNVIRKLYTTIVERPKSQDEFTIIRIRRMGVEFCRTNDYELTDNIMGLADQTQYAEINGMASRAVQLFSDEKIDE